MAKFAKGNSKSSKLKPMDIPVILARRANGEGYRTIAFDYGVTTNTIARACNGDTWQKETRGLIEETILDFATPIAVEDIARAEAAMRAALDSGVIVPQGRIDIEAIMARRERGETSGLEIDRRDDLIDKTQEIEK